MNHLTEYIQNLPRLDFLSNQLPIILLCFVIFIFILLIYLGWLSYHYISKLKKIEDKSDEDYIKSNKKISKINILFQIALPLMFLSFLFLICVQVFPLNYISSSIDEEYGDSLKEHIAYLEEENDIDTPLDYSFETNEDGEYFIFIKIELEKNQELIYEDASLKEELKDSIFYKVTYKSETIYYESKDN